jgi:type I restriction enzyme S subunit
MTDIMLTNASAEWPVKRLGQLFRERKEKVSDKEYPALSVTKSGIVPQLDTAAKTDDGDNRKGVHAGDYVINSRSDRKGSSGISQFGGSVSLINIVLEPLDITPRFAHHLLRSYAFQEEFYRWGHGIVADLWTTRYSEMKNIRVAIPDAKTQGLIAEFLDHEISRIDYLIDKKQNFAGLLQDKLEAIVHEGIVSPDTEVLRFKYVSNRVVRPVKIGEGDSFIRLGLFNRGRGIFKKPETLEDDMGDSSFFWVESGDLILSGQFAWEGAIALASEKEHGCVVSHRYPVYRGNSHVKTAYLLAFFRTKLGNFILNNTSRGAAGRNKPLNTNLLDREKIPIPNVNIQSEIERIVEYERLFKDKISISIQRLHEYRSTLITAAVTGQINVTTWGKQGQTDRRLVQIEEAVHA